MNFLIVLGILTRLLPHPANMTALGATSFIAGSMKDRKIRWAIPVITMLLSDLIMSIYRSDWLMFSMMTPVIYISVLAYTQLGWLAVQKKSAKSAWKSLATCTSLLLAGSTQFYLVTNTAAWWLWPGYSQDLSGLLTSLVAGLPFYRNQLAGDAAYFLSIVAVGALAKRLSYTKPSIQTI